MDKKYQVFVSSTYEDLKEERAAVVTALLKNGYIPVCMEYFTASNRSQWEVIESIIPLCDYYVVIVAGKYGSTEPETGISYTQKEYELAFNSGVPCLGFVHRNINKLPMEMNEQDPQNRKKLEEFTKTVKSRMCSFWDDKHELAENVLSALHNEVSNNPRVGWIRADQTEGSKTIQALQKENAQLKDRVQSLSGDCKSVLVYGVSSKSVNAVKKLENSSHYSVAGFIIDKSIREDIDLRDWKSYYFHSFDYLKSIADSLSVRHIVFADEQDAKKKKKLIDYCSSNGIKTLVVPTVDEVIEGKKMTNKVRDIRVEDLICREKIKIDSVDILAQFQGKSVMVTGAAGSVGSEICRQLAYFGVGKIILFDNAETPMHSIRLELEERYPGFEFVPVVGDIRETARLDFAFKTYKPQIVFHSAAYKHIPLMEENPCEAVLVNVAGTRNVADKCLEYGVEEMILISTDKAINPANIMGCSKRLAEIYVQSLGVAIEKGKIKGRTKFITTRFCNLLGSYGSVIPRFRAQIERGGPVTVSHPEICRFFMSFPQVGRLLMEAATIIKESRIVGFRMGEAVKISDLAARMIEFAGFKPGVDIKIEYTGLRPGEKLYEDVPFDEENTLPTAHELIRVVKVREYEYEDALETVNKLTVLSQDVNVQEMVKLMKEKVPEFKSMNSRFEVYDK